MSSFTFLQKVPLFAGLPVPDLEKLCQQVEELSLPADKTLFNEGSLGQNAYVITQGQIEIYKTSDGKHIQIAVRLPGEIIGEMALLQEAPRSASARALSDCHLIVISHEQMDHLLDSSPSASRTMLSTITSRLRDTELMLRQSEKMAQLGTLMAGIAHELNNPAAAVNRGANQLKTALDGYQNLSAELLLAGFSKTQMSDIDHEIRQKAVQPVLMDSMTRNDREAELEEWLDNHGIENGWQLVPQLANLLDGSSSLDAFTSGYPEGSRGILLRWMAASYEAYTLLDEIGQGAGRISEIVKALKSYVYLDQAPLQEIDIHEGLENTLVILRYKIKQGVEVVRDYDPQLPRIMAYGSELNQVWTNILDNALDAMAGKGRIKIRTAHQDAWVVVEIEDNGPGIPSSVKEKIFNPFFTTKPLGKGTGLGLNITYNIIQKHHGDIQVFSQTGRTVFEIRLPINFEQTKSAAVPEKPPIPPAID
ncbi:MAG: cyclic nucleotide-binding domain-containing protein [Anaerolineaceae bacterium]|nr:cyclic nucleotide-binding domain-containing protein [Anaerolineaceae bacterium]